METRTVSAAAAGAVLALLLCGAAGAADYARLSAGIARAAGAAGISSISVGAFSAAQGAEEEARYAAEATAAGLAAAGLRVLDQDMLAARAAAGADWLAALPAGERPQALLKGSVFRDGDGYKVTVRLVNSADGRLLGAGGLRAEAGASDVPPDVILLDLNMPNLDGRQLLARLRRDARFTMTPVIVITGDNDPREKAEDFGLGADDFIAKPFDSTDLVSRVEGAARRSRRMLAANPLTLLPGGPTIEEEASRRIKEGGELAFFHIDIDNFKAFNDSYGYLNGDNAIKSTGALLSGIQECMPEADIFVGHIGGDDFVLMARHSAADRIAGEIIARFDSLAPNFYNRGDRERGYITAEDRSGAERRFPLMTLSIAVATNERRTLDHYAKIVDIASEIKKYLKGLKERSGSLYLKDRRVDRP